MTTHSLREGHQLPLIVLQRAINDHTLPYRGPTTTTHCLTEDEKRPLIVLQRAINDHS